MCGRFTQVQSPAALVEAFGLDEEPPPLTGARYNIAPSQLVAAVRVTEPGGARMLAPLRWGLVPAWADSPAIGNRLINARSEQAAEKPAFRAAFAARRCLIPADGFFEWEKRREGREPYYFTLREGGLFGLAGLWERWRGADGAAIESCTILTTAANELVGRVHDRMPVILEPRNYERWLDPGFDQRAALEAMLGPYPAEKMACRAVSRIVNSPQADHPGCIEPLAEGQDSFF